MYFIPTHPHIYTYSELTTYNSLLLLEYFRLLYKLLLYFSFLAGEGAVRFALTHGIPTVNPSSLISGRYPGLLNGLSFL